MKRNLLLLAGLALTASAFAATPQKMANAPFESQPEGKSVSLADLPMLTYDKNTRTVSGIPARKAPGSEIYWKRPAGQFWGTGYCPDDNNWYYFTPVVLRPWIDYTFENISTGVSGDPLWEIAFLTDPQKGIYETLTANTKDVTVSYLLGETCAAPRLSYGGSLPFATIFYNGQQVAAPNNTVKVAVNENIKYAYYGINMPVSSHFYSLFTFSDEYQEGLSPMNGLDGYDGMQPGMGMVFGTNKNGINAVATRFEMPDRPYLINSVQWLYVTSGAVPANIPLKAYVYKTADPAAKYESADGTKVEGVDLGELIAYSESFIPKSLRSTEGVVEFKFKGINSTTGVESEVSLEINDDITIVVTGFDVNLGNGQFVTSYMSLDFHDEGYGHLGYIGSAIGSDKGLENYSLVAMKDMIGYNTVAGVLADVSYPWLYSYFSNQPDNILLSNEGATTEEKQGLDYGLYLVSTSMTEDFNITFNGEEDCDWLGIIDVYDEMYTENGQQYFSGNCGLRFQAEPNPYDVSRTCVVKITIPAASYEITFRQGSNNTAVEAMEVSESAIYYDLAGRRVANPEKGVYIKKTANKAEKVLF